MNGLEIYGVSDNPQDKDWIHILTHHTVGPREFLGLINDANLVVTDSYHGTIFSLLHHKDFITLERFTSNDALCQNSRISQLVEYFGINKNILRVNENTNLDVAKVDYDKFELRLTSLRKESLDYIINALK